MAYSGVCAGLRHRIHQALLQLPCNDRIPNEGNIMSVGEHYRPFQESGFFNPGGAGHLSVSIQRKPSGKYRIILFPTRKNGGDTGPNRACFHVQLSVRSDYCLMAHLDAGHICDCIEMTWGAIKQNTQISCSWFSLPTEILVMHEITQYHEKYDEANYITFFQPWFSPFTLMRHLFNSTAQNRCFSFMDACP